MAMIEMGVRGIGDWKKLSRALRKAPPELRKQLRAHLRREGQGLVGEVKDAALGLPDGPPPKSTGIRAATARATRLAITQNGIRVEVSQARMGDQAFFPRAAEMGSWRHPVFGSDNWVSQSSQAGWFTGTCTGHAPEFRRAVEAAIEDTARALGL